MYIQMYKQYHDDKKAGTYDNYKAKLKGKENSANSELVMYVVAVRNTICPPPTVARGSFSPIS